MKTLLKLIIPQAVFVVVLSILKVTYSLDTSWWFVTFPLWATVLVMLLGLSIYIIWHSRLRKRDRRRYKDHIKE